jgi:hypothetical protein
LDERRHHSSHWIVWWRHTHLRSLVE